MKRKLALEEAMNLVLNRAYAVEETQVAVDCAYGRILSRDIKARHNVPPFDRSPLDGFAMRAADIAEACPEKPVRLEVMEKLAPGQSAGKIVVPGHTVKVVTGSPVPLGADVVIKFEEVREEGDFIEVSQPLKPGSNIILRGEDIIQGETVAVRGTVLSPALVGLLAGQGICCLPVYKRPRIALFSTGDELLSPDQSLQPGKVYNTSLYTLQGRCRQMGAESMNLGIVRDRREDISNTFREALQRNDLVISTGGVSVGEHDLILAALSDIGAEILFWQLAVKPGTAAIAAEKDGKLIVGLSGNPAAALVVFDLLVVPVIRKMRGEVCCLPRKIKAIMDDGYNKPSPQRRFLRARLRNLNGIDFVRLNGEQGNGILKSLVNCNFLIDVPAGSGALRPGQEVSGYMLGVNPFNQPGVEAYKKNMFALMNKPGFEAEHAEVAARVANARVDEDIAFG